jgi:hypothetical protein
MNEKSILSNLTHAFIVKMAGTFQDDRFDFFFRDFFSSFFFTRNILLVSLDTVHSCATGHCLCAPLCV